MEGGTAQLCKSTPWITVTHLQLPGWANWDLFLLLEFVTSFMVGVISDMVKMVLSKL